MLQALNASLPKVFHIYHLSKPRFYPVGAQVIHKEDNLYPKHLYVAEGLFSDRFAWGATLYLKCGLIAYCHRAHNKKP